MCFITNKEVFSRFRFINLKIVLKSNIGFFILMLRVFMAWIELYKFYISSLDLNCNLIFFVLSA